MRVISDEADAYGEAQVVVALDPSEFEALEDTLDVEVPAKFHVEGPLEPLGSFETWREAAEEIVAESDYSLLVERVAILKPEEGGPE